MIRKHRHFRSGSDYAELSCRPFASYRLQDFSDGIEENGGRVTDDLYDSKLTHIVCSGPERYEALVRATAEFVRRLSVVLRPAANIADPTQAA